MGQHMLLILVLFFILLLTESVMAHCPLCVVGAAAAAGGATWLGVSKIVIGVFIGGFAVSTALWVSRLIKRKYIPFQTLFIVLFSFLTMIIPLMPMVEEIYPLYISIIGDYGSLLNRTYVINLFFVGSIAGSLVVVFSPAISRRISRLRNNKLIPYQGVILTIALLILASIILQVVT